MLAFPIASALRRVISRSVIAAPHSSYLQLEHPPRLVGRESTRNGPRRAGALVVFLIGAFDDPRIPAAVCLLRDGEAQPRACSARRALRAQQIRRDRGVVVDAVLYGYVRGTRLRSPAPSREQRQRERGEEKRDLRACGHAHYTDSPSSRY